MSKAKLDLMLATIWNKRDPREPSDGTPTKQNDDEARAPSGDDRKEKARTSTAYYLAIPHIRLKDALKETYNGERHSYRLKFRIFSDRSKASLLPRFRSEDVDESGTVTKRSCEDGNEVSIDQLCSSDIDSRRPQDDVSNNIETVFEGSQEVSVESAVTEKPELIRHKPTDFFRDRPLLGRSDKRISKFRSNDELPGIPETSKRKRSGAEPFFEKRKTSKTSVSTSCDPIVETKKVVKATISSSRNVNENHEKTVAKRGVQESVKKSGSILGVEKHGVKCASENSKDHQKSVSVNKKYHQKPASENKKYHQKSVSVNKKYHQKSVSVNKKYHQKPASENKKEHQKPESGNEKDHKQLASENKKNQKLASENKKYRQKPAPENEEDRKQPAFENKKNREPASGNKKYHQKPVSKKEHQKPAQENDKESRQKKKRIGHTPRPASCLPSNGKRKRSDGGICESVIHPDSVIIGSITGSDGCLTQAIKSLAEKISNSLSSDTSEPDFGNSIASDSGSRIEPPKNTINLTSRNDEPSQQQNPHEGAEPVMNLKPPGNFPSTKSVSSMTAIDRVRPMKPVEVPVNVTRIDQAKSSDAVTDASTTNHRNGKDMLSVSTTGPEAYLQDLHDRSSCTAENPSLKTLSPDQISASPTLAPGKSSKLLNSSGTSSIGSPSREGDCSKKEIRTVSEDVQLIAYVPRCRSPDSVHLRPEVPSSKDTSLSRTPTDNSLSCGGVCLPKESQTISEDVQIIAEFTRHTTFGSMETDVVGHGDSRVLIHSNAGDPSIGSTRRNKRSPPARERFGGILSAAIEGISSSDGRRKRIRQSNLEMLNRISVPPQERGVSQKIALAVTEFEKSNGDALTVGKRNSELPKYATREAVFVPPSTFDEVGRSPCATAASTPHQKIEINVVHLNCVQLVAAFPVVGASQQFQVGPFRSQVIVSASSTSSSHRSNIQGSGSMVYHSCEDACSVGSTRPPSLHVDESRDGCSNRLRLEYANCSRRGAGLSPDSTESRKPPMNEVVKNWFLYRHKSPISGSPLLTSDTYKSFCVASPGK